MDCRIKSGNGADGSDPKVTPIVFDAVPGPSPGAPDSARALPGSRRPLPAKGRGEVRSITVFSPNDLRRTYWSWLNQQKK
jgi:hypothetical protein